VTYPSDPAAFHLLFSQVAVDPAAPAPLQDLTVSPSVVVRAGLVMDQLSALTTPAALPETQARLLASACHLTAAHGWNGRAGEAVATLAALIAARPELAAAPPQVIP
jgi:hypothetical protein